MAYDIVRFSRPGHAEGASATGTLFRLIGAYPLFRATLLSQPRCLSLRFRSAPPVVALPADAPARFISGQHPRSLTLETFSFMLGLCASHLCQASEIGVDELSIICSAGETQHDR